MTIIFGNTWKWVVRARWSFTKIHITVTITATNCWTGLVTMLGCTVKQHKHQNEWRNIFIHFLLVHTTYTRSLQNAVLLFMLHVCLVTKDMTIFVRGCYVRSVFKALKCHTKSRYNYTYIFFNPNIRLISQIFIYLIESEFFGNVKIICKSCSKLMPWKRKPTSPALDGEIFFQEIPLTLTVWKYGSPAVSVHYHGELGAWALFRK